MKQELPSEGFADIKRIEELRTGETIKHSIYSLASFHHFFLGFHNPTMSQPSFYAVTKGAVMSRACSSLRGEDGDEQLRERCCERQACCCTEHKQAGEGHQIMAFVTGARPYEDCRIE